MVDYSCQRIDTERILQNFSRSNVYLRRYSAETWPIYCCQWWCSCEARGSWDSAARSGHEWYKCCTVVRREPASKIRLQYHAGFYPGWVCRILYMGSWDQCSMIIIRLRERKNRTLPYFPDVTKCWTVGGTCPRDCELTNDKYYFYEEWNWPVSTIVLVNTINFLIQPLQQKERWLECVFN